mgnify:CR=1 FL=1
MAKTLNQFLEGYLKVKNPDEQKFVDKHVVAKHPDRNGNGDEVFKGSKVKPIDRRKDRHGYNPGEDEKVYEEAEELEELSKDTVRGYYNKAGEQGKKIADRMKIGGGDWSKDGKDTETLKKRAAGRDMALKRRRGEVKMSEEAEELEELSKKTLGSYVSKAASSAADKGMEHGVKKAEADEMDRVMNRHMSFADKDKVRGVMKTTIRDVEKPREKAGRRIQGINRAVTRLTKEESEQIDEISATAKDSYAKKAVKQLPGLFNKSGEDADAARKYYNRKNTVRKISNEELEQVDELSKKTLTSFLDKTEPKNDFVSGGEGKQGHEKGRKLAFSKLARKTNGQKEMKDRMFAKAAETGNLRPGDYKWAMKEEQDRRRAIAIAAKLTAERGGQPLRKEEKLTNLLGDLTEAHRRTMLTVFEKLNENNQKKFLEACETPDGVEQMLDFAINHRGE